ncbi:MAG: hypothetical protein ACREOF_13820 [Gemmatimonadales bacterium]
MTPAAARAATDPLGLVLELIGQVEPGLAPCVVTNVLTAVAPGRNVRRRLAQALAERPALLTDGRSPAPRVVGSLLIALRRAGAVRVSAPVCAGCGKPLGSLQRRGQDWYCGVCGPRLEPCVGCGKTRRIARRDRTGQPLCQACCPNDGGETMHVLHRVITAIDPDLAEEAVATAVQAAARPGQRHQLAWTLEERPELLTGAGAEAPIPAVLRLIEALIDAGARGIVRPPCPCCGRIMALSKVLDGVRVCRSCLARSRAQSCTRCGAHREPATRDERGRPLCPHCLSTDPVNQETCSGCGRRRPVSVRTPDGPLCGSCRPVPTMICSICARSATAVISKLTGQPCCHACLQRRARCTDCGTVKPIRGGTLTDPLCATCTRPDASWHACPGCGEPAQLRVRSRRCARCSLRRRLGQLLADDAGQIHPQLQALHEHLAEHDRPDTVLSWLNKRSASAILQELATGHHVLSHATLDEMPDSKPLRHLRSMLVATGALPPRDEHLARLEHWITTTLAARDDPEQRALLHRYAVWHLLHRLRCRNNARHATHGQTASIQQHIRAAIAVLDWLTRRHLELATAGQGDLEAWLASGHASHRREAGHFVRWANRQKLTSLEFAAARWDGPTGVLDSEQRWAQARQLLDDDTLNADDRLAGLLVLLYAQRAAAISRLTLEHIQDTGQEVRLRLGHEPVLLPEPLAPLVRQLAATRHGHASLGDQGRSRWLFPGGRPDQPISAEQLTERLRQLGLRSGQARSTALFGLAAELPAAMLARLLGIHISVAVAWQRVSSGDWTSYAADYSRRRTSTMPATPATRPGD